MLYLSQQIANALPLAALYALLAFGYALAFAVTKRTDLSYGAIFAFSGQIYVLFADTGWNRLWLVLPAALALGMAAALAYSLLAALVIGQGVLRRLALSSRNGVIVAGLGALIVLMETARIAADTRSLWLPPFLNRPVALWHVDGAPVVLTALQLVNAVLMAALIAIGATVLARSRAGRVWRAVADDSVAACFCGIDAGRVVLLSYLASAMIAAIAGLMATSYYGTMDFGAGMIFSLKVVMLASIGGTGEPLRAALGAAVFGVVETAWASYAPIVWRDLFLFSLLVLVVVMTRRETAAP